MSEKKRFNITHGFFCPFFSKPFYADVAKHWTYHSYLFLLLLTIVLIIPALSQTFSAIDQSLRKFVPGVAQQLPTIHIKGGKAEVENYSEPQEIIITKDEDYKIALLIDLETDKETLLDKTIDENTILLILTKDELIGFEPDGGVSELPLSTFEKDITLSKDNIGEWIDSSVSFAAYIGIPFFVLFLFIFRISLALLMALLADATKPNTITLSFTNAMSLGIVAMTPSIMISTAVQYFGVHIPFSLALYATISILYLRFALKAVEELAPTPTEAVITNVNNE